jgi:imidazolonepropionase-like amidohydrolase
MKVRGESVQTRCETGTRSHEAHQCILMQYVEGLNGETARRSRVSALAAETSRARTKAKSMTKRNHVSFKNALQDGIPIAMGTDAGTPFNFHGENAQELERMVALGISPMQAILASTSAAAQLIGIQNQAGTIEKGKLVDLLLFKGNPLRRIDLLRDRSRIMGVMQSGRFVAGPISRT